MTLQELVKYVRVPVYLTNEERALYLKLRKGTALSKLNERERDVILYSLKLKGLVE